MAVSAKQAETRDELLERLIQLVQDLEYNDLYAADRFITYLHSTAHDPVLRAMLNAPFDDEPETPEERAAVEEALEDVRAGRVLSHEEARSRLFGTD